MTDPVLELLDSDEKEESKKEEGKQEESKKEAADKQESEGAVLEKKEESGTEEKDSVKEALASDEKESIEAPMEESVYFDEIEIPENMVTSQEDIKNLDGLLKEAGIKSNEARKKVANALVQQTAARHNEFEETFKQGLEKRKKDNLLDLKMDPLYGEDNDRVFEKVEKEFISGFKALQAMDQDKEGIAKKAYQKLLDYGLETDPVFRKLFRNIGRAYASDSPIPSKGGPQRSFLKEDVDQQDPALSDITQRIESGQGYTRDEYMQYLASGKKTL